MTKRQKHSTVSLTPLYPLQQEENEIQKIVRRSNFGKGDVETVLLREGNSLQVVIRDQQDVHEVMELEEDSDFIDNYNRMCWANFEGMEQNVLCVLTSPTQVRLWDSKTFLGEGEGTAIHLPCEAMALFSLKKGILVQRKEELEGHEECEDNDMFLSSKTPLSYGVASLFSLSHPLRPLLPVAESVVAEKVIFVPIMKKQQLCVTFNSDLERHSLWILDDAPPMPSHIPLPQQLKVDASATFLVDDDLFHQENSSFYDGIPGLTSRQEALADALGVGNRLGNSSIQPNTNTSPIGVTTLSPAFLMTLSYESLLKSSRRAKNVFLAGSCLCISCDNKLHLWQVKDATITQVGKIDCYCALPIQSLPNSFSGFETDILTFNGDEMHLYRGGKFLTGVTCSWKDPVYRITNPVGSRFTVELQSGQCWRVNLQLNLSPMAEQVLSAVHAYLKDEFVLHIRFDAVKLTRQMDFTVEVDPSWVALSLVLSNILLPNSKTGSSLTKMKYADTSSSHWDMLKKSNYHFFHGDMFTLLDYNAIKTPGNNISTSQSIFFPSAERIFLEGNAHSIRLQIFDSIHLLYEEYKLSVLKKKWSEEIRVFLMNCLSNNDMNDFHAHYDAESLSQIYLESKPLNQENSGRLSSFDRPPCIMSWVRNCLLGQKEEPPWIESPVLEKICSRIKLLYECYSIMTDESNPICLENDIRVAKSLLDAGVKDPLILQNDFPMGVAIPLLHALARCRHDHYIADIEDFSSDFWNLIGREDICQSQESNTGNVDKISKQRSKTKDGDDDGLVEIEHFRALRFPDDNRLKEVGRLLRSSRPSVVKVARAVEVTDHDYERLKQERLLTLCQRTLALPVGRGMYSLGTLKPVPAEQLPIPELCLSGRVPPTNNSIALDLSNTNSDMTVWPDFHNGAAAGLRLPPKSSCCSAFSVSRSWIIYNRATTLDGSRANTDRSNQTNCSHGGLLMALGLRGHLSALSMTDVYEYLTQGSVTTSVGVLLGMAANRRGSCDPSVSKMLCLHIPSLLPPSFSSIDVAAPAHAAAVAGIGLLYQGSSHRLMTEFLLNEMGRRPVHESSTVDREAYTVSCGLSLGMINLARGGSGNNAGLADLEIEQRLYRYVVGGVDNRSRNRQQDIADRRLNGNLSTGSENERSSRVYEGDSINHDVTAPGALLALGLIYLKSGNKAIAASLAPPDTHFLLEYVRPDTLMLRVVTRSLIMWNEVEPSSKWIQNQIPAVVRRSYLHLKVRAEKAVNFPVLDIKEEKKTANKIVYRKLTDYPKTDIKGTSPRKKTENEGENDAETSPLDTDVDRQTVRQIHVYILAGSCFSIGLRFAGTSDARAAATISEVLLLMKSFRDSNDPVPTALKPEQSIVGMCLGICAVSLALVMAGTGDLDTLRLLKMIRWRSDDEIRHGSHMTIASAIGMLFLGGGMCTVGRSDEDIAALVAAFYPRYPMNPMDNKYHLQALRHLYVLAVKERNIQTFDIDSGEEVSVLVKVHFDDSNLNAATVKTPGLLRNTDSRVLKLVVQSDIHFASSRIIENISNQGYRLLVKKRIGNDSRIGSLQNGNFVPARSHSQKSLAMLRNGFVDGEENQLHYISITSSKRFSLIPLPILYILSFVRAMKVKHRQDLAWDTVLLECFYARTRDQDHQDLIDLDSAALLLEKAKHALENNFGRPLIYYSLPVRDAMDISS